MMEPEIKFFEDGGHSPAWAMIPKALLDLDAAGYAFHPYQPPAWNDPCLMAIDEKGNAAGFLIYRYNQERASWFILLAWVDPAHRRSGIHTKLFAALVERAEKRGDILMIESGTHIDNISAQRAFEAQGRRKVAVSYEYRLRDWREGKSHLEVQQ